MREVKGSYLLWGTIGIYLLYLLFGWIGIDIFTILDWVLKALIFVILGVVIIATLGLVVYSQFVIPYEYLDAYDYYFKGHNKDMFKNFYLHEYCNQHESKWIRFSLYYWIVVAIIEINNFCNKYFTFKF